MFKKLKLFIVRKFPKTRLKFNVVIVQSTEAEVLYKEADPINFALFTGKQLCWSLFKKVAWLKACNVIDKRLQYRCFPVNIAKIIRHLF